MIEKLGITPGPWEVSTCLGYKNSGFKNNEGQSVKHSSSWIEEAWSGREADDESKANDRLIAAAPEMLEALIDSCMIASEIEDALGNALPEYRERMKNDKRILAIEKATNKTWTEIKELL